MKSRSLLSAFAVILILMFSTAAIAGEATDRIKAVTDKLIEIVTDHKLDPPNMAEKRARMIRDAVDSVFDWSEFSKRAMGRYWNNLSNAQKKEFVNLFGQLLERTYMEKTRHYSGEKMIFTGEDTDNKYGTVDASVTTKNGANVPIKYRVIKENGKWWVYDVSVEGISLVHNYKVQFNNILSRSSYDELLRRLKAKVNQG